MSPRALTSPVDVSWLRSIYNDIEQALGSEDAEVVWRSIPWRPDPAQRLLELAHRQFNGTLTQAEWTELNRLFDDPAVKAAPGPGGKKWLRKAGREASAFFDQLRSRYGERIARQAMDETLDREAQRPAKANLDTAMRNIKAWLKSRGVKDYCKQTAGWLSEALQIDLASATRRLERAEARRRSRTPT
jgi:hypothetical protein